MRHLPGPRLPPARLWPCLVPETLGDAATVWGSTRSAWERCRALTGSGTLPCAPGYDQDPQASTGWLLAQSAPLSVGSLPAPRSRAVKLSAASRRRHWSFPATGLVGPGSHPDTGECICPWGQHGVQCTMLWRLLQCLELHVLGG